MDFPILIDTVSMVLSIVYFKGSHVEFLYYNVFLSLKVVLIVGNSADPEEMLHSFWVFTICQSTRLGVSTLQRVNSVSLLIK